MSEKTKRQRLSFREKYELMNELQADASIQSALTLCGTNFSSAPIYMRLCTLRFFGALNTYLLSDFRNSKWQTEYGGRKSPNSTDIYGTRYLGVFCIAQATAPGQIPIRLDR